MRKQKDRGRQGKEPQKKERKKHTRQRTREGQGGKNEAKNENGVEHTENKHTAERHNHKDKLTNALK